MNRSRARPSILIIPLAVLALLPLQLSCGADGDDPGAVTDIRIHELRDAIRAAPALPRDMEQALTLLPPARRDEQRRDGYGSLIQYSARGPRYELRSPGADRVLNTRDDYVLVDSLSIP